MYSIMIIQVASQEKINKSVSFSYQGDATFAGKGVQEGINEQKESAIPKVTDKLPKMETDFLHCTTRKASPNDVNS